MGSNRKSISQYILTFAFFYSSMICFSEAINKWENEQVWISILLWVCGSLSFIAIFRWKIADFFSWLSKKYE